ncbi:hypothetical protein GCM10010317_053570 [Streptomyces mirabilis]|nr:hypothetical protein GCM10010317_053570 [Streptomyces mirabilis]
MDSGDGDTEEWPGAIAGCQMQRDRTAYRVSDEDDPGGVREVPVPEFGDGPLEHLSIPAERNLAPQRVLPP